MFWSEAAVRKASWDARRKAESDKRGGGGFVVLFDMMAQARRHGTRRSLL